METQTDFYIASVERPGKKGTAKISFECETNHNHCGILGELAEFKNMHDEQSIAIVQDIILVVPLVVESKYSCSCKESQVSHFRHIQVTVELELRSLVLVLLVRLQPQAPASIHRTSERRECRTTGKR